MGRPLLLALLLLRVMALRRVHGVVVVQMRHVYNVQRLARMDGGFYRGPEGYVAMYTYRRLIDEL